MRHHYKPARMAKSEKYWLVVPSVGSGTEQLESSYIIDYCRGYKRVRALWETV